MDIFILLFIFHSFNAITTFAEDTYYDENCKVNEDASAYAKTDDWQQYIGNNSLTFSDLGKWKESLEFVQKFLNYCDFLRENKTKSTKDNDYMKNIESELVKPEFGDSKGKITIREAMTRIIEGCKLSYASRNCPETQKENNAKIDLIFLNLRTCMMAIDDRTEYAKTAQWRRLQKGVYDVDDLGMWKQNFKLVQKYLNYDDFLQQNNRTTIHVKPVFGDSNGKEITLREAMGKIVATYEIAKENSNRAYDNQMKLKARHELKLLNLDKCMMIYNQICNGIEDASAYAKTDEWQTLKGFSPQIAQQEDIGTNHEKFAKGFESIERFIKYCDFLRETENENTKGKHNSEDELELIAVKPEFGDTKGNKMTIREAMPKIVAAYENRNKSIMHEELTAIPGIEFFNLSKCTKANVNVKEYKESKRICMNSERASAYAKLFTWQKVSKYNEAIRQNDIGERLRECKRGFECVEKYFKYCEYICDKNSITKQGVLLSKYIAVKPKYEDSKGEEIPLREAMEKIVATYGVLSANTELQMNLGLIKNGRQKKNHDLKEILKSPLKWAFQDKKEKIQKSLQKQIPDIKCINLTECEKNGQLSSKSYLLNLRKQLRSQPPYWTDN